MDIYHLTHPLDEPFYMQEPNVRTLGFFDGVHKDHQRLLQKAKNIATQNNFQFTVMTFDPHPSEIIIPLPSPNNRCRRSTGLND